MVKWALKEARGMDEKRRRMTAKRKFEVYLETRQKGANVGEILRRYGLHLNDLRQIEATVEKAAIAGLTSRRNGLARGMVTAAEYAAVVTELERKEHALAELSAEHMLLKKSDSLASKGLLKESTYSGRGARR